MLGNVGIVDGMPRPAGHKLNRAAFDDVLRLAGLTLTGVASIADVPRATMSSLYGGYHGASTTTAHRIAKAAGCHPATLFPSLAAFEAVAS